MRLNGKGNTDYVLVSASWFLIFFTSSGEVVGHRLRDDQGWIPAVAGF